MNTSGMLRYVGLETLENFRIQPSQESVMKWRWSLWVGKGRPKLSYNLQWHLHQSDQQAWMTERLDFLQFAQFRLILQDQTTPDHPWLGLIKQVIDYFYMTVSCKVYYIPFPNLNDMIKSSRQWCIRWSPQAGCPICCSFHWSLFTKSFTPICRAMGASNAQPIFTTLLKC